MCPVRLFQDGKGIVFYIICVYFVVFNVFTLEWFPLPWIDEIYFVDSPVNFVLDGEWRTTSVWGDKNGEVYSLYPPLYQFLLVPFIWVFGVSVVACRSLNVILVFVFCIVIYRLLQRERLVSGCYSIVIFLLLVWCADVFSWIYRNGRPDVLNMVCATGFMISYYKGKGKWWLIVFACLTVMSGIQACPYLLGILICMYFFLQDKRKVKRGVCLFFLGSLSGLFFMSLYFYLHGHLIQFYYVMFVFSSTAKSIVCFLIPYIEAVFPVNITNVALTSDSESISFFRNLIEAYTVNKEYIVLCAVNGLICLSMIIKKKVLFKSVEVKMLLISLIVPAIMALAGRFASYYTWMCYLPSVLCSIYILEKYRESIRILTIYGFTTLLIVSLGLPKTLISSDRDAYHKIETFIQKQNFSDKDKIVSPFMSYYAIRNITKTCWFTGLFPLYRVPGDTKYILKAENDYQSENMDKYIQHCESEGKTVYPVDSLMSPKMILYIVEQYEK